MRYRYRLAFTDVDFARLLFSGDYYRFAERAFETLQQEHGLGWKRMIVELGLGLPSVETRCQYLASIGYEHEFEVGVGVRDLNERGFVTDFEVVRLHDSRLAAYGYFVRRFLDMATLRPATNVPAEAMEVFASMEAATRSALPTYEERVSAWQASRTPPNHVHLRRNPWERSSSC